MTTDATVAPRRMGARRRYSEQVHVLVDEATRAYLLGVARLEAVAGGYELPRESEGVRELIDEAIMRRYEADPKAYAKAVRVGSEELAERAAARAARAWRAAFTVALNEGLPPGAARVRADEEVPEYDGPREVPPVAQLPAEPPPA